MRNTAAAIGRFLSIYSYLMLQLDLLQDTAYMLPAISPAALFSPTPAHSRGARVEVHKNLK